MKGDVLKTVQILRPRLKTPDFHLDYNTNCY